MFRKSIIIIAMFTLIVAAMSAEPGETIPAFARKYGFACSTCHLAVPKLKKYGDDFAANGFQLPDKEEPVRAYQDAGDDRLLLQRNFPVAVRLDFFTRYRTKGEVKSDFQTPYGLKFLSGGNVARDIGYYFYFYMNERGEIAGVEDAYLYFNNIKGKEFDLLIGQFQVSDPLLMREIRLTYEDYKIYTTRVGRSRSDLTYGRGIMTTYSLPTKTDITFEVVNGGGIGAANEKTGMFDEDNYKNVFGKVSQNFPNGTIGVYAYTGKESELKSEDITTPFNNETNSFLIYGPIATVTTDMAVLSAQYVRRTDDNPDFRTGAVEKSVTEGIVGEAIFNPFPKNSRLFGILLYNKVTSDYPGLEYETVTGNISYLLRTNLRVMCELTRDLKVKESLFTIGAITGF